MSQNWDGRKVMFMKQLEEKVDTLIRLCAEDDSCAQAELREQLRRFLRNQPTDSGTGSAVCRILRELGVPEHLSGYLYLVEAVELVVKDPGYLRRITSGLYADVAKKYQTSPARAERAIRHAIETAWNRCDLDTLAYYFGNTVNPAKGKPVNSEFIARVSNAVRQGA